ncbi:hypothetical protein ACRU44_04520 [Mycobacterium colombiense]
MTAIDPFTARAAAKLRHPAGTELDGDRLTPQERRMLLHQINERRNILTRRRRSLANELRQLASELGVIDQQLSDCERAESFLLDGDDRR